MSSRSGKEITPRPDRPDAIVPSQQAHTGENPGQLVQAE